MSVIKVLTASAVILLSFSALADVRIVDTHNGAWVMVRDNGQPVSNANVNLVNVPQQHGSYKTDDNGQVFIPITLENSRSVKYQVTTKEGANQYRYAFHSSSK